MTDGSREQPKMTAGLDLGDKYTYLCLIDTQSGEVNEEGRLRTTPEAFRRGAFGTEQRRAFGTCLRSCCRCRCRGGRSRSCRSSCSRGACRGGRCLLLGGCGEGPIDDGCGAPRRALA